MISFPLSAGQPCRWCNSLLTLRKQFEQIRRWTQKAYRHPHSLRFFILSLREWAKKHCHLWSKLEWFWLWKTEMYFENVFDCQVHKPSLQVYKVNCVKNSNPVIIINICSCDLPKCCSMVILTLFRRIHSLSYLQMLVCVWMRLTI